MSAYLSDPDVSLYCGDALEVLRELPDRSVHMCATSPPFYGLRDYGTGTWKRREWSEKGKQEAIREAEQGWLLSAMTLRDADEIKVIYSDPDCSWRGLATEYARRHGFDWGGNQIAGMDLWLAAQAMLNETWDEESEHEHTRPQDGAGEECECGARRIDRQIGLEESPDEWVARLVEVFREVRRVLRDDGTLWVECGDSYNAQQGKGYPGYGGRNVAADPGVVRNLRGSGIKPKDLLGQPWLLAFALRADGWVLRSEIIWSRPNPMPESVTDRPTKAHSTVFLLSKAPRYFYDAKAIREAFTEGTLGRGYTKAKLTGGLGAKHKANPDRGDDWGPMVAPFARQVPQTETLDGSDGEVPRSPAGGRVTASGANARSVWTIPTQSTSFQHFATWPEALVRRMILAGTSERGVCPECGAPWLRELSQREEPLHAYEDRKYDRSDPKFQTKRNLGGRYQAQLDANPITTVGWRPSCVDYDYVDQGDDEWFWDGRAPLPATVLDPFAGSGTTLLVARKLGRRAIGIELAEPYCKLASERLAQQSLFAQELA